MDELRPDIRFAFRSILKNPVISLVAVVSLALTGVGIGLAGSLAATRGLSFFLLGVSPFDLPTFATVATLLMLTGLFASYLPARRATHVDSMLALRPD